MHMLSGPFRRRIAVGSALGLQLLEHGCTVLDDDYYPRLVEPSVMPAAGASGPDAPVIALPVAAAEATAPIEALEGVVEPVLDEPSGAAPVADETDAVEPPSAERSDEAAGAEPDAALAAPPEAAEPPSVVAAPASEVSRAPCDASAFGAPERIALDGIDAEVRAPTITADGKTLFFAVSVEGGSVIYTARRSSTTSIEFGDAAAIGELSTLTAGIGLFDDPPLDAAPFVSGDGQRLYFSSSREGSADTDLWLAERAPSTGRFAAPSALSELNARGYDLLPWLPADELSIVFVSTRPTRTGTSDLWIAERRSKDEAFGAPQPLSELNTKGNEGRLVITADALTVYFSSDRDGAADLFTASRLEPGEPFSAPVPIDVLNSDGADHDVALSADGRELFFASTRDGLSALWRAVRSCG